MKKISKEKIKNSLINIYNSFMQFIKYNRQYFFFVVLSIISCSFLRMFTIGGFFNIKSMAFDTAIVILIGALAYLFKPRKQFYFFQIVLIIITIINIVNAVYYSFFNTFPSFKLLATMGQATEQGGAVLEKLKLSHFIYLLMPIIYYIIHKYLVKRDYFNLIDKVEDSKKLLTSVLIVGSICLFLNISTLKAQDLSRFSKQWNREYIVERFGIIIYQFNDLFQTVRSNLNSMFGFEEAAESFAEYYNNREVVVSKNEYTGLYKGYNVVVIHMESIMSFLVDLKINGEEVTPNLNKLVRESMYFNNFYPQVSVGTSSDTEFTFNTSLLPVQSGTVFVNYYNRNYVTLEKLLSQRGYYTFSMHGNKASMWNRNKMHESLGYNDFYSQEYYDIDEVVGLGLSDRSFFIQSENIIKQIDEDVKSNDEYSNWMGTIIQLSNHTPFADEIYTESDSPEYFDVTYHTGKYDSNGEEIIYDYLEGKTIGNYLKSVHYADKCLGEYLDYVKKNSEYDKTLFVFYGDHAAQLSKSQFNYFVNYNFTTGEVNTEEDEEYIDYDYYENELFKNTPLIFWTKDKSIKGEIDYPMGMIDALPTISNMLGISNPYALGNDIFEIKDNNTVVFPNGNFLTNKLYYNNSRNESRIIGNQTIDDNYIAERKEYAEKILDISNDIIVYDLIEKAGNRVGVNND